MDLQGLVKLADISQILHSPTAKRGSSCTTEVEIQESGNKSSEEPLSQFAEAGFGRERADGIFCVSAATAKQACRSHARKAKERLARRLLSDLAYVRRARSSTTEISINGTLYFDREIENGAIPFEVDTMMSERTLPVRGP